MERPATKGQKVQSPLSDLMFDWIAILHSKGKGLAAYEKYIKDAEEQRASACQQMLERLRDQDYKQVEEIKAHLRLVMERGLGLTAEASECEDQEQQLQ